MTRATEQEQTIDVLRRERDEANEESARARRGLIEQAEAVARALPTMPADGRPIAEIVRGVVDEYRRVLADRSARLAAIEAAAGAYLTARDANAAALLTETQPIARTCNLPGPCAYHDGLRRAMDAALESLRALLDGREGGAVTVRGHVSVRAGQWVRVCIDGNQGSVDLPSMPWGLNQRVLVTIVPVPRDGEGQGGGNATE